MGSRPPTVSEAYVKEKAARDEATELIDVGAYGDACDKLISAQHWAGYSTGAVWATLDEDAQERAWAHAEDVVGEGPTMTDQANICAAAIGACRFASQKVAEPGPWGQGNRDAVSRALEAVADVLEDMGGEDATS